MVESYADEYQLLMLARQRQDEAFARLFAMFTPMILGIYRDTHSAYDTLTPDEAMEAGRLGIFNAVFHYREDRDMAFHNFVRLCVTRELRLWQRREYNFHYANSQPVISLDYTLKDTEGLYYADVMAKAPEAVYDPAQVAGNKLRLEQIFSVYRPSSLEGRILAMRCEGYSYREISQRTGLTTKNIDNLLLKVRRKIAVCNVVRHMLQS
jgi:RNA polymerase sigma factor (sigma-70 family)